VTNSVTASILRRLLALLSACGFVASVVAYANSFSIMLMNTIFGWWIPLGLCAIGVLMPIYVVEYPASKARLFFWRDFARGMPSWVVLFSRLLLLVTLGHFVWFFMHSGLGAPSRDCPLIRRN
jgi:hypothetical protein